MKQLNITIELSDDQHAILQKLCDATGKSEQEYIKHATLFAMEAEIDVYFNYWPSLQSMRFKIESGIDRNDGE